mgnify:CR=1 FL=1
MRALAAMLSSSQHRLTRANGDYSYVILDDGTASITGYSGTAATVNIPSTVNGKKVTEISKFYNKYAVKVVIPDTVTYISGFENSTSI